MRSLCLALGYSALAMLLLVTQLTVLHLQSPAPPASDQSTTRDLGHTKQSVLILLWTTYYGEDSALPEGCHLTYDRSQYAQSQSIVFHGLPDDLDQSDLPSTRHAEQPWIFFLLESPAYQDLDNSWLDSLQFNGTMSYDPASDFVSPYGYPVARRPSNRHLPSEIQSRPRTGVVWMCSHCVTDSRRESLVHELRTHLNIDIYGTCGDLECDPKEELSCYARLGRKYQFYLSFENSLCPGYVTEKLSNALWAGMVPIVYGAANYSYLLPKHSYIDVRDYPDMRTLSVYLKYLMSNTTAYGAYLQWHSQYEMKVRQGFSGFQRLCEYLAAPNVDRKPLTLNRRVGQLWHKARCRMGPKMVLL